MFVTHKNRTPVKNHAAGRLLGPCPPQKFPGRLGGDVARNDNSMASVVDVTDPKNIPSKILLCTIATIAIARNASADSSATSRSFLESGRPAHKAIQWDAYRP